MHTYTQTYTHTHAHTHIHTHTHTHTNTHTHTFYFDEITNWHQRRLLLRNVQWQWKFETMTYGRTDLRTDRLIWVGARDACASKKGEDVKKLEHFVNVFCNNLWQQVPHHYHWLFYRMFYNCSQAVKCGNKKWVWDWFTIYGFAAVSIWCQMQPDLQLFSVM